MATPRPPPIVPALALSITPTTPPLDYLQAFPMDLAILQMLFPALPLLGPAQIVEVLLSPLRHSPNVLIIYRPIPLTRLLAHLRFVVASL